MIFFSNLVSVKSENSTEYILFLASLSVIFTIQRVIIKFDSRLCNFKAYKLMNFVKNSMGGREVNMMNTLSKNSLSKIG